MNGLADRLAHVLWIGGAPRAGKTTLARQLAGKYDLRIYNLDWHHVREHRAGGGRAMGWWDERTPDQRWLDVTPSELLERSIAAWDEGFPLVVDDILALPTTRTIIADGPGAFPWLVAPLITDHRQAIFLVGTPEVRQRILAGRGPGSAEETTDPLRARANLHERDLRLGVAIGESCTGLGLRCVQIDGSLDLDASLTLLEDHFGPHLPTTLNV
ncbi:MAG TPA: hypothetical protein VF965_09445 [Candidatus Limnocylindria bacterium]